MLALSFVVFQQLRETPKVEAAALLQKAVTASQSRPAAVKRVRITTRTGQMTRVIGVAYKPAAARKPKSPASSTPPTTIGTIRSAPKSYAAWRDQLPHFQDAIASQPDSYDIKTTTAR